MCMPKPKVPEQHTPPPQPKVEDQKTDDDITRRKDQREKLKGAVNSGGTILGGARAPDGKKTLLGQ